MANAPKAISIEHLIAWQWISVCSSRISTVKQEKTMIPDDEPFRFAEPRSHERKPETPGLVESLEDLRFRTFTDEW
jgi:hypothetical protein